MSPDFAKKFSLAWPLLLLGMACSQKRDEPQAPREEGSVFSDASEITEYGNIPIVLESSDAIPSVSNSPTTGSTPTPAVPPKVSVTSSCSGNFSLQVAALDGTGSSSTTMSGFSGCDGLSAKLNGKKLPTGNAASTVPIGTSVKATCDSGNLTLVIVSGGSTLIDSLNVFGSDVCLELRDLVHSANL